MTCFLGKTKDLTALAFEYAERNNISHRFNRESKMAAKEWLHGFTKRLPDIWRNIGKTNFEHLVSSIFGPAPFGTTLNTHLGSNRAYETFTVVTVAAHLSKAAFSMVFFLADLFHATAERGQLTYSEV